MLEPVRLFLRRKRLTGQNFSVSEAFIRLFLLHNPDDSAKYYSRIMLEEQKMNNTEFASQKDLIKTTASKPLFPSRWIMTSPSTT